MRGGGKRSETIHLTLYRPSGVGMGRKPPVWLKDGDIVEVELEGVGVVTNKVEFTSKQDSKL